MNRLETERCTTIPMSTLSAHVPKFSCHRLSFKNVLNFRRTTDPFCVIKTTPPSISSNIWSVESTKDGVFVDDKPLAWQHVHRYREVTCQSVWLIGNARDKREKNGKKKCIWKKRVGKDDRSGLGNLEIDREWGIKREMEGDKDKSMTSTDSHKQVDENTKKHRKREI